MRPQDLHLLGQPPDHKTKVGRIGRVLAEGGVHGYPLAQPDLRPGMIEERVVHIDQPYRGPGGKAQGPGHGHEEDRVLVAVAPPCIQDLDGVGNGKGDLLFQTLD